MKTFQLFFAVFALTALCSLTTLQAQTNLVTNPGFETVSEDGTPADWTNLSTTLAIEVVSDTVYAGSNSLRVSTTDYAGEYMVAYIPVTAGKTYNLSAWCNLQSYTGTSSARTRMGLLYTYVDENGNNLDAAGNILSVDITSNPRGSISIAAMTSATNTWQQLSLTTSEVTPSNAAYIVLALSASRVTAYFDNVSVTEVGAVSKQDQSISGLSDMDKTVGDADFSLSATATSGLAVSYSSSNTAVATISGSTVHIVGAGATTITASQAGNDTYNAATDVTAALTVTAATVAVTGVTLNKTTLALTAGSTETLTATLAPETATNKTVTWSSSDANIATVDATGKVTAVAAGTATITVTTVDGSKTATCAVTVSAATVAITGVTLNKTTLALTAGGTETLTATLAPETATNTNVAWSSSDVNIATVDATGLITAVAAGTATITVTTVDGSKTAICAVTVSAVVSYTWLLAPAIAVEGTNFKVVGTDADKFTLYYIDDQAATATAGVVSLASKTGDLSLKATTADGTGLIKLKVTMTTSTAVKDGVEVIKLDVNNKQ